MSFNVYEFYNVNSQRMTGIPYFIIKQEKKLSYAKLKEYLLEQEEIIDVDLSLDYDIESLYVPEIFGKDGIVSLKNKVESVSELDGSLFCTITTDYIQRHYYRESIYIIVRTNVFRFEIIYDKELNQYFIIIYCARTKSKVLKNILNKIFINVGIALCPSKIIPKNQRKIQEDVKAELLIAQLHDYPELDLDKIIYIGQDIGQNVRLKKDLEVASISGQMFNYFNNEGEKNVVSISDDGLVRFWNSVTHVEFKQFLRMYVFKNLSMAEPTTIPLDGFIIDKIIYDEEGEE